jgi:hypothetical protein
MWEPLRTKLSDDCVYAIGPDTQFVTFVMEFAFPEAALSPTVRHISPGPETEGRRIVEEGATVISFEFEYPQAGQYVWELHVERFR